MAARKRKRGDDDDVNSALIALNDALTCPVELTRFKDPVYNTQDGHTYSRAAIERLSRSPLTRAPFNPATDLLPNRLIEHLLEITKEADNARVPLEALSQRVCVDSLAINDGMAVLFTDGSVAACFATGDARRWLMLVGNWCKFKQKGELWRSCLIEHTPAHVRADVEQLQHAHDTMRRLHCVTVPQKHHVGVVQWQTAPCGGNLVILSNKNVQLFFKDESTLTWLAKQYKLIFQDGKTARNPVGIPVRDAHLLPRVLTRWCIMRDMMLNIARCK